MSDERLAEIRGRLGVLLPHASKLGVQAMADDMQYLLGRLAAAEARAAMADAVIASLMEHGKCRICLDIEIGDVKPLTHHDWCPLRVMAGRPASAAGEDVG